jgi:hypothetical protein
MQKNPHMRTIKMMAVFIFIANFCISQEKHMVFEVFNDSIYSIDKFKITIDSLLFDNGVFEVIKAKPLSKLDKTKVFIRRTISGPTSDGERRIIIKEALYSGFSDSKNIIYHPILQPINNKYIIIDCIDKKEIIHIIGISKGQTVRIDGYYYALSNDSTSIYTKTKDNATLYKYNIEHNSKSKISYFPKKEVLVFHKIEENEKL